jgi:hypothetical protein
MEALLSLLLLIVFVDFGYQFLQQKLYSPEPLSYLVATTECLMFLRIFLAEAGGPPLQMCQYGSQNNWELR